MEVGRFCLSSKKDDPPDGHYRKCCHKVRPGETITTKVNKLARLYILPNININNFQAKCSNLDLWKSPFIQVEESLAQVIFYPFLWLTKYLRSKKARAFYPLRYFISNYETV